MNKWLYPLTILIIFVLDQTSKIAISNSLNLYETVHIFPGLNFHLAHNTGAAFSFLASHSGWQRWFFVVIAIVISMVLSTWLYRLPKSDKLEGFAISCILGGALGNLLDRILHGFVIDFIDVYYQQWHWYTFNLADSTICFGAFLITWLTIRK